MGNSHAALLSGAFARTEDFSQLINRMIIDQEEYKAARKLLLVALKRDPNSAWLMTRICETYYEERNYSAALKYGKMAYRLRPKDPLILWNYAGSFDMLGKWQKASEIYERIIAMSPYKAGRVECTEGVVWARSIVNDSRYRLGLCWAKRGNIGKGVRFLRLHMMFRREKRVKSIYPLRKVKRDLKTMLDAKETGKHDLPEL